MIIWSSSVTSWSIYVFYFTNRLLKNLDHISGNTTIYFKTRTGFYCILWQKGMYSLIHSLIFLIVTHTYFYVINTRTILLTCSIFQCVYVLLYVIIRILFYNICSSVTFLKRVYQVFVIFIIIFSLFVSVKKLSVVSCSCSSKDCF